MKLESLFCLHIWLNMLQREFINQENGDISILPFLGHYDQFLTYSCM